MPPIEQIKCPDCGAPMRMSIKDHSTLFSCECWICGTRGPWRRESDSAISAFCRLFRVEHQLSIPVR